MRKELKELMPFHWAVGQPTRVLEKTIEDYAWRGVTMHIDQPNEQGETALMIAARRNQPTRIRLLLDGGAEANVSDHAGLTALDHLMDRLMSDGRCADIDWRRTGGDAAWKDFKAGRLLGPVSVHNGYDVRLEPHGDYMSTFTKRRLGEMVDGLPLEPWPNPWIKGDIVGRIQRLWPSLGHREYDPPRIVYELWGADGTRVAVTQQSNYALNLPDEPYSFVRIKRGDGVINGHKTIRMRRERWFVGPAPKIWLCIHQSLVETLNQCTEK